MQTAEKVMEQIEKEAKEKNRHEERFVQTAKIGEVCRQGDVYIIFVSKNHPKGKLLKDHQLAPGQTKGSRHIAADGVEVYEGAQAPEAWRKKMKATYPKLNIGILEKELLGPRLFFPQRALITHPEHANFSIPSGSDCQVLYQLNPRTMKRAED